MDRCINEIYEYYRWDRGFINTTKSAEDPIKSIETIGPYTLKGC
jgi:hypothetical protein